MDTTERPAFKMARPETVVVEQPAAAVVKQQQQQQPAAAAVEPQQPAAALVELVLCGLKQIAYGMTHTFCCHIKA